MNALKRIRRTSIVVAVSIASLHSVYGQNLATTIKVQAMDMGTAFIKNDFERFSKYMHPNIIAFAGGKDKMKSVMDSAYQAMKLFGVSFKRYWIGDPGKIINYKDQLQAVQIR
jgi:hypothetical protein